MAPYCLKYSFYKFCFLKILLFQSSHGLLDVSVTKLNHRTRIHQHLATKASSVAGTKFHLIGRHEDYDQCISLYSLQWTPDECISKPVRDVWKWKDGVLGDGRDFFVPKPKTISKLQQLLLTHVDGLRECSVLSNCARFEVLCVWENNDTQISKESRIMEISSCLLKQVKYYDENKNQFLFSLTQSLDRPSVLLLTSSRDIKNDSNTEELQTIQELAKYWECYNNPNKILWHLCEIAAGMAIRPRRPDRAVIFRPFSSRDAHILLQLKRTKEIVSSSSSSSNTNTANRILEYALRAGKAARNPKKVPSLKLLEGYGDGSSKYSSSDPPLELSNQVKEDVLVQAINPLIEECLEKIAFSQRDGRRDDADDDADDDEKTYSIQQFRKEAMDMATTPEELKLVKQKMHQPTVAFRLDSKSIIVKDVLQKIQQELQEFRQQE